MTLKVILNWKNAVAYLKIKCYNKLNGLFYLINISKEVTSTKNQYNVDYM